MKHFTQAVKDIALGAYALVWLFVFVLVWVYCSRDRDASPCR